MKKEIMTRAVGQISDSYIDEAAGFEGGSFSRRGTFIRFGVLAACLAAAVTASVLLIDRSGIKTADSLSDSRQQTADSILPRPYADFGTLASESAVIFPWEYLTEGERYRRVTLNGNSYSIRSTVPLADTSAAGESLGSCEAEGYDEYTEKTYRKTFEAFKVIGADSGYTIAVRMEQGSYIFRSDEYDPPETLGELFGAYGLKDRLELGSFSDCEDYKSKGSYKLSDGAETVRLLSECSEARLTDTECFDYRDRRCLSFSVTCPELGINNKALSITEDGLLMTNMFEYGFVYDIGSEKAGEIIASARKNALPAVDEPASGLIGGRITEIGEGFIRIDDSELCEDPGQGMVFTVPTEDIKIKRCVEFSVRPKVGDTVAVYFNGEISGSKNTVGGAYDLVRAHIGDGGLNIPE